MGHDEGEALHEGDVHQLAARHRQGAALASGPAGSTPQAVRHSIEARDARLVVFIRDVRCDSRALSLTRSFSRFQWLPSRRQMATAVPLLSPVIMTTRMPAREQRVIQAATSGLGGSNMPTQPTKVRSVSYCTNRLQSSRCMSSFLGGVSLVAKAKQRSVSEPEPQSRILARICSLEVVLRGAVRLPTRTELQRSITLSGAPFTNILLPWTLGSARVGVQYTDIDFRSRENSRVNSFRMSCLITELQG